MKTENEIKSFTKYFLLIIKLRGNLIGQEGAEGLAKGL
jgi:hypothetical protein